MDRKLLTFYLHTPLGPLEITLEGDTLHGLRWSCGTELPPCPDCLPRRQIEEYLHGERTTFDLPTATEGTPFQRAVWEQLARIPYGLTVSYGDVARAIGRPKAFRAVARACHDNPLAIIVPCHRVVASTGRPHGYNGGVEKKIALLNLESRHLYNCVMPQASPTA